MDIIRRYAGFFTPVPATLQPRPIVAGVLHDTETVGVAYAHSGGSWHYLIHRNGTIYQDVPEEACAWHVATCDRYRPSWLIPSPLRISDPNWCTLGIELVSHAEYRHAGEPYTDAQYQSLEELLTDIHSRRGRIPWIGHGWVQRDRTDPVLFNWERANFGPHLTGQGRYWHGAEDEEEMLTPDEKAALAKLRELAWNEDSIIEAIEKIGAQEFVIGDLAGRVERAAGYGAELQQLKSRPKRVRLIANELAAITS